MRKNIPIIFIILCLFFTVNKISAQENSIQTSYRIFEKDYRYYQSLIETFNTAKSKNLQYNSVTSQAEYLQASKNLLMSEINSLISFTVFLKLKLSDSTKILKYNESTLYLKLDDENAFLNNFKENIIKISTLEENKISWKTFKTHYLTVKNIAFRSKSLIEIIQGNKILDDISDIQDKMSVYLDDKKQDDLGTKAANDKLTGLAAKLILSANNIKSAENLQGGFRLEDADKNSSAIRNVLNQFCLNNQQIISGYENIINTLQ